jgi:transcriptional regulator with PAS, ATPase and Fis domain
VFDPPALISDMGTRFNLESITRETSHTIIIIDDEEEGPPHSSGGILRMEELERKAILESLQRNEDNRLKTALELGIGLRTLQRKLKEYEVGK